MAKSNGKLVALLGGVVVGERRSPRDYVVAIVATRDAAQVALELTRARAELANNQATIKRLRAKLTQEQVDAYDAIRVRYDEMKARCDAAEERGEDYLPLWSFELSRALLDHPAHDFRSEEERETRCAAVVERAENAEPTGEHTVLRWSQTMRAAQAAFGSFADRYATLTLCPVERR